MATSPSTAGNPYTRWQQSLSLFWQTQFWLCPILCVALVGGAQILIPQAYSSTGFACGLTFTLLSALSSAYTSQKICWQAYYTGQCDYETLGYAVMGRPWKAITELGIFIAMFGSLMALWVAYASILAEAIIFISPSTVDSVPWLVTGGGRVIMVFLCIICLPSIFMRRLSAVEKVADVFFLFMGASVIWLMANSISRGMPFMGVKDQFGWSGFTDLDSVAGMAAVANAAFIIQPMMMPMLSEVPAGKEGIRALGAGALFAIFLFAVPVYMLAGIFGAADFGRDQAAKTGNFLLNDLNSGKTQGIFLIFYSLAGLASVPIVAFTARHSLDSFICMFLKQETIIRTNRWRNILLASIILGVSLGVGEALAGNVTTAVLVTSAIGIFLVVYFTPIINHFALLFGWAGIQRDPKWMDTAPISVGVLLEQAAEEEKPGRLATHLMSGRLSMAEAQVLRMRSSSPSEEFGVKEADVETAAATQAGVKAGSRSSMEKPLTATMPSPFDVTLDTLRSQRSYRAPSGPLSTIPSVLESRVSVAADGQMEKMDYEYRLVKWSVATTVWDVLIPAVILMYGGWASVLTLKLVGEGKA